MYQRRDVWLEVWKIWKVYMMNRSVLKSGSNLRTLTKSEFSLQACRTINVLRNLPWKYRTLTYFKAGESYFTEFLDIHDLYTFSWHAFFCKKKKWYHWGYFRVCISLLVSDGSKFLCITEDCIWGREAEGTKIFWSTSGTLAISVRWSNRWEICGFEQCYYNIKI